MAGLDLELLRLSAWQRFSSRELQAGVNFNSLGVLEHWLLDSLFWGDKGYKHLQTTQAGEYSNMAVDKGLMDERCLSCFSCHRCPVFD